MNNKYKRIIMKRLAKKIASIPFFADESADTVALVGCSILAIAATSALAIEGANYYKTVAEINTATESAASFAAQMAASCATTSGCVLDTLVDDFVAKRMVKRGDVTISSTSTEGFWSDDGKGKGIFVSQCPGTIPSGGSCDKALQAKVHTTWKTATKLAGDYTFSRDTTDVVRLATLNQVVSQQSTGSVYTLGDLCPMAIDYGMFTSDNGNTYDRYWSKTEQKPSDDGYFPGGDLPDGRSYGNHAGDYNGSNGYKFTTDNMKSVAQVAYLANLTSSSAPSWAVKPGTSSYYTTANLPNNLTSVGAKVSINDKIWLNKSFPVRKNVSQTNDYSTSYTNNMPVAFPPGPDGTYYDSPVNPNWFKWATVGKTCLVPVVNNVTSSGASNSPNGGQGRIGTIKSFSVITIRAVCPGTSMWKNNHWDAYTDDKYTTIDSKCEYGSQSSYVHPYVVFQMGNRDNSGSKYAAYDAPNTRRGDNGVNAEALGSTSYNRHMDSH